MLRDPFFPLLFGGDLTDTSVATGFVAAAVTAVVGLWVGTEAMRRSN